MAVKAVTDVKSTQEDPMSDDRDAGTCAQELDALLGEAYARNGQGGGRSENRGDDLDRELASASAAPKASGSGKGKDRHEEDRLATNGELKRENRALRELAESAVARERRQAGFSKTLAWVCLGLLACNGITILYVKSQERRSLEKAFRLIDSRERKFLLGNVMVLDRFAAGLDTIAASVVSLDSIDDEERKYRIRTIQAVKEQNAALEQMYKNRLQEAETERNRGPEFSYRDPFLKKEIDLSDAQGGAIDMDLLAKEIGQNYDIDGTVKSLKDSMMSPIPLAEQLRQSAEKRKALESANGRLMQEGVQPGMPSGVPTQPSPEGQQFGDTYGGGVTPGSPYTKQPDPTQPPVLKK
jgi:hypothetical protein